MTGISTHVLDTSRGEPAQGIRVTLERTVPGATWTLAGQGVTDSNGRVAQFLENRESLEAGLYKLTFYVDDYFGAEPHFFPQVSVQFLVRDPSVHYHVPLLLSPYGYTTYRGS
ncbi:MAG TPA: hydroxyisourate hydrolase [Bryobacteraceae bacterium]|nr:hydroxyisourate hydrolase [Bryobacteraceae bacterium]